jgi:DNA-binding CsgD family transcriptional regulator
VRAAKIYKSPPKAKRRGRKPDVAGRERMAELRAQGLSLKQIGRILKVSKQTVHVLLNRRGKPIAVRVPRPWQCTSGITTSAGCMGRCRGLRLWPLGLRGIREILEELLNALE